MPLAQHTLTFTTAKWLLAPPAVSALHAQQLVSEVDVKKTIQQEKFETNREYKFDTAMQSAANRASAHQPKMINMVSKVKEAKK